MLRIPSWRVALICGPCLRFAKRGLAHRSQHSALRGDRMKRRLPRSLLAAFLGTGLVLTGGATAASAASATTPTWKFTPVVAGLNGPRGIAFDSHGNLYVAEAGQFQPVSGTAFKVKQTGQGDKFRLEDGKAPLGSSTS